MTRPNPWFARVIGCASMLTTLALTNLALAPRVHAQGIDEYRLKAAYLFNFASFTEWPGAASDTLTVCIYGDDPFGPNLDAIAGKSVGTRRIRIHRASSVDGLADCQLVFITRAVIGNLPRLMDTLGSAPVLTVADSPGAMQRGVMLNMDSTQGKVTFSANLAAARRQKLNLSAKLLSLATEVNQ
jgi:hypothetical protein